MTLYDCWTIETETSAEKRSLLSMYVSVLEIHQQNTGVRVRVYD